MRFWLYLLLFIGLWLFSLPSIGAELKEVSIEYKNYGWINDNARNSLIYPEPPKESINLNLHMDLINPIFWNSAIESMTTAAQYRSIGLQTRLGIRLIQELDISFFHHSQHVLDRPHSYMNKFPVEDAIEFKFYIFGPKRRGETFF